MDIREKLVELLRNSPHLDTVKGYKGNDCTFEQSADWLIRNGVTVQGWISVKERLPEVGSRVIACGEKWGVFVVKSEGITTGFGRMDGTSKYRSFTHWMPLPEAPKGK